MYYPPVEHSLRSQILSRLEKINGEKIVYVLLFMLPAFAVTVRHWVSDIFVFLSLTSLVLLYRRRKQRPELEVTREERFLLWGFAAYFGVFVLTSLVNGWGPLQTRYTGVDIRFLLFVPLYLVIRPMPGATRWLVIGAIFGVVFTSFDAVRQVLLHHVATYTGIYSPLFTGPVMVLLVAILVPYFYGKANNVWLKLSLLLITGLAFFVASQTGARNSYMAAVVLSILFIFHQYKGVKRYAILGAACLLAYGAYLTVDKVHDRVHLAYAEFKEYAAYQDPAKVNKPLGSIGTRLEMWRVTPMFFKDNPIFGVGRGEYSHAVQKYIKEGRINKDIGYHSHPHNVFSESLISKGLLGLIVFLWITLLPLFILIRDYRNGLGSAIYGIMLISGYLVLSLTEASPFIKGNFSSIYIIFLAVLFAYHMQQKQPTNTT